MRNVVQKTRENDTCGKSHPGSGGEEPPCHPGITTEGRIGAQPHAAVRKGEGPGLPLWVGGGPRIVSFPGATDVHIELHGASSTPSNHGRYLYSKLRGRTALCHESWIPRRHERPRPSRGIDYLFPAMDSVALELATHQEQLACKVIGSPRETCRICCSKRMTYETFAGVMPVPVLYHDLGTRFPLADLPEAGLRLRVPGDTIGQSRDEAEFFLDGDKGLLAMEYLPGREYTVDCFTDRHGKSPVRRSEGAIANPERNQRPQPAGGGTRFQELAGSSTPDCPCEASGSSRSRKDNDGTLTLLEIAPRVAGTMALYRNLGSESGPVERLRRDGPGRLHSDQQLPDRDRPCLDKPIPHRPVLPSRIHRPGRLPDLRGGRQYATRWRFCISASTVGLQFTS